MADAGAGDREHGLHGLRLAEGVLESLRVFYPVFVVLFRDREEYDAMRPGSHAAWEKVVGAPSLTSVSGLIKLAGEKTLLEEKPVTFFVRGSFRRVGQPVLGDVRSECNFNNRAGAVLKEVGGYMSGCFFDGCFRGIAVSTDPVFLGRALSDGDLTERGLLFLTFDTLSVSRVISGGHGLGPSEGVLEVLVRCLLDEGHTVEELTGVFSGTPIAHGSFCGPIGFVGDLYCGMVNVKWLWKDRESRPPFLSEKDVAFVKECVEGIGGSGGVNDWRYPVGGRVLDYFRNRKIFFSPICSGARKYGLQKREGVFVTEPYAETTGVVFVPLKHLEWFFKCLGSSDVTSPG